VNTGAESKKIPETDYCPVREQTSRADIKRRCGMIRDDEDVTDVIARFFAFIAIPAALFVIAVALWTIFRTPGNI